MALLGGLTALGAAPSRPRTDGDDRPVVERTGETLVPPQQAWRQAGFRLRLGIGRESIDAPERRPGPRTKGTTIVLKPGYRLDGRWLLETEFRYGVLVDNPQGLRWAATAGVAYRVAPGSWADALQLGIAAGYAGFNVTEERRYVTARFGRDGATVGRLQERRPCSAGGAATAMRASWIWEVSAAVATGPTIQYDRQWTTCTATRTRVVERPGGSTLAEVGPPRTLQETFVQRERWTSEIVTLLWEVAWR